MILTLDPLSNIWRSSGGMKGRQGRTKEDYGNKLLNGQKKSTKLIKFGGF
jgi:hypothetical protein